MAKGLCKMTLKDLVEYLNSQQDQPGVQAGEREVEERVLIVAHGTQSAIFDVEQARRIVRSCGWMEPGLN